MNICSILDIRGLDRSTMMSAVFPLIKELD